MTTGIEARTAANRIDHAYRDRASAAKEAKAAGRPVVGYVGNTVPVEMIRAAGAFAWHVTGQPDQPTPLALERMEDFFDGWILSIFDQMLAGELDWLDAVVVPRSSEVQLQLYYHILEVRRTEPGRPVPAPVLFDILHSPGEATRRYDSCRLAALRERVGHITGRAITDAALAEAIAETDAVRDRLARLDALRREVPPRLAGSAMLRAVTAAMVLAPDEFLSAADALLSAPAAAGSCPAGPRLLLTGSLHDTDGFHRLVEGLGGNVVADDHMWGGWWFDDPVGAADEPMDALVAKYHRNAPSPRTFPRARVDARLMRAVERSRPDAVVFFTDEWDDTFGFDYPTQRDMLAERDIPTLFLKEQSYRAPDRAAQAEALRGLFDRLSTRQVTA